MHFNEWEPVYLNILSDLGLDRASDEASARMLKMLTLNSDVISDDVLGPMIGNDVVIAGGNLSADDIGTINDIDGTLISAGSATDVLMMNNIVPKIIVTDLDGDAELQKRASASGSVVMVHAHGDNTDLIAKHVKDIKGPMMITTQSVPDMTLYNFGGFTDGDRAVCTARHFGAKNIKLIGFDMHSPAVKSNTDMEMKKRKLQWADRIIFEMNADDVIISML